MLILSYNENEYGYIVAFHLSGGSVAISYTEIGSASSIEVPLLVWEESLEAYARGQDYYGAKYGYFIRGNDVAITENVDTPHTSNLFPIIADEWQLFASLPRAVWEAAIRNYYTLKTTVKRVDCVQERPSISRMALLME